MTKKMRNNNPFKNFWKGYYIWRIYRPALEAINKPDGRIIEIAPLEQEAVLFLYLLRLSKLISTNLMLQVLMILVFAQKCAIF